MNDWETTLNASLRERWKHYRRALKRCQRKLSEKSVHASRVETRRLLALVDLLDVFIGKTETERTRRVLKRHLAAFNALRDTQVQLLLLDKYQRQFPETKQLRQMLVQREQRCLRNARRRIRQVKIHRLKKVFRDLSRQLAQLRKDAAGRAEHRAAVMDAVDKAFNRVNERQRKMNPGEVETIHRTRVAFKKFRYMLETMQPLFANITAERVVAMQNFQSMMGEVQDTDVFLVRLDKFVGRQKSLTSRLARFRHWLLRRHTSQIAHCLKHADRIRDFWPLTVQETPAISRRVGARSKTHSR